MIEHRALPGAAPCAFQGAGLDSTFTHTAAVATPDRGCSLTKNLILTTKDSPPFAHLHSPHSDRILIFYPHENSSRAIQSNRRRL